MGKRIYLTNLERQVIIEALKEQLGNANYYLSSRTGDKIIQRAIDKVAPPSPNQQAERKKLMEGK